ncbi:MAG TPA: SusC/RagA family TonB-linked outer membrane protein [Chitinophagaceae bacterium]|nr:SusC/RagA family TonB-linked outer membrane protein [Chitinophagaceae bacterium]
MRKSILLFMALLITAVIWAQQRTIKGKVTDAKGVPITGATVSVKGQTAATQTDAQGNFVIQAAQGNVLVISNVGYAEHEVTVGAGDQVNVSLQQRNAELSEVVVTALGVSREKRTLGYATSTFKNEEINRVAPVSIFDGLQGKVAGADISNVSGSPGGSTKVILRGYSSLVNGNQPLYVVDGVPLSDVRPGSDIYSPDANANKGTATPGYDFGNTANDINPNDIESISILKGAAATSLYGSRAANGVIIITTRKGRSGKLRVDVTSSAVFSKPGILPRLQKLFGQGWDGRFWASENGSWGPKLDGVDRLWGATVDNSQLIKPFAFVEDNVRNLYETGREYNNTLTLSGGNEASTFLFSYGNVVNDGFLPTDNDFYRRNTFSLRGTTRYKGFTAEGSFNYVNRSQRFVENGQSASGVGGSFYEQVLQFPVDIPIRDFRDYKNKFFNVDNFFTPFAENPYYNLYENGSRAKSDRFYGNINLQYKLFNWLTLQVQQGIDVTNSTTKLWRNKNAPKEGSWNAGFNPEGAARQANVGNVQEGSQKFYEYDGKVSALVKHRLNERFTLDGFAGLTYNERGSNILYSYIEDLAVPGFFDISNGVNPPQSTHFESKQAIMGLYGSATIGYNDYLYLTLNARNDWSSTLPKESFSYFYPSANVSFLLTNLWSVDKSKVSYAKLRASYGRTGKDATPYQVLDAILSQQVPLPFGTINFPFNGVPGYTLRDRLGNRQLQPEISTEAEIGGEFKFLNDRIGFDIAYYHKVSEGQIIPTFIAPSTGYNTITLNFGKIRNRGIELSAMITPVRTRDITWDINYTFTRNRNLVTELPSGLNKFQLTGIFDAKLEARLNQPLGVFYAPVPKTDSAGRIVVDATTGFPVAAAEDGFYGDAQRDYTMGLVNTFTYKNFRLGFSFDYRKGGVFYSSTSELLMFTGNHYKTTYNNRQPFILPNSVNEVVDGNGKVTYVENTTPIDEEHQDDWWYANSNRGWIYQHRIMDKTFLKLRDVTLSYTLPASVANKIRAERIVVTLIGRNLWTWLPKDNQIVDPESSNFGRDILSEFGEFRVGPMPRSFGASVRVSF